MVGLMVRLQHAKIAVSASPELVDFGIRLVNSVVDLPDGRVKVLGEIQITEEM